MKAIIFLSLLVTLIQAELVTEEAIMDITVGGKPAGQIKIGLFGNTVPKTVRNFATICADGINGKTYAGSAFHRVIKNFMLQGGDIIRGDGTGSTSIYGGRFDDENFNIKHTSPGFLSMANSGPNTNGCQFFITAVATPWLDGHHVVFGKVTEGLGLVKQIENSPTGAGDRPTSPVVINQCSINQLSQPYDLPLGNEKKPVSLWIWLSSVGPPLSFSIAVILFLQWIYDKLDRSSYNIEVMIQEQKQKLLSSMEPFTKDENEIGNIDATDWAEDQEKIKSD